MMADSGLNPRFAIRGRMMEYIKRAVEDIALHSDKTFKSLLITGARPTRNFFLFLTKKVMLIFDPLGLNSAFATF